MSERGFFAIDRGVWDHPLFAREKFTEVQAWFWLISSAAWEPVRVRIGRGSFDLQRGQCAFALRFLATKWMWSEPRVRRFLKRLTDDAAVLVSATREATLITICNYNDYQLSRRTDVPEIDARLDAKPTNPRRKEEENKQSNKEEITISLARKRAVRLPGGALPSERNRADAAALGLTISEIENQWRRMRDWSASAKNGACLDWDARWRNWCEKFMEGRGGYRTANSRTTGHDAILAAATRAAGRIVGDDGMAGTTNEAQFSFGDGAYGAGSELDRGAPESAARPDDRRKSQAGGVLEGEIIAPDKTAAGISDGWLVN